MASDDAQEGPIMKDTPQADEPEVRFSPEQEASLLATSNALKAEANTLFNSADPEAAITLYKESLASCPAYLPFPRAVLQSNIAACYLKTEDYPDAAKYASDALDSLDKLDPQTKSPEPSPKSADSGPDKPSTLRPASQSPPPPPSSSCSSSPSPSQPQSTSPSQPTAHDASSTSQAQDVEAEIISAGAARSAPKPPTPDTTPSTSSPSTSDIARIRIKALLRRARARSLQGGWSNLASAEQDYKALAALPPGSLTAPDMRTVRAQLAELPTRVKVARESEMAEMWGKLKGLGNSILKPFGLSTENFQMVKDENTGGYSMNFTQGRSGGAPPK